MAKRPCILDVSKIHDFFVMYEVNYVKYKKEKIRKILKELIRKLQLI